MWLFASRFDVPPTHNGSENSIRGYKLAAKIGGCWRTVATLATLQRHCRTRSYLTSARNHQRRPSTLSATPLACHLTSAVPLDADHWSCPA